MSTTSTQRTGADAAERERPQRSRFPWWLLLVALALIALVVFLLTRGGDGAGDGTETSQQQAGESAGGSATQEGAEGAEGADGEGADGADPAANPDVQPGKVTAGGATVYPLSEGLTVGDYDGEDVIGHAVPVESVVADDGFWIGTTPEDRIFVLVTAAESAPDVQAGDTIDFEGVVAAHGDGFAQQVGVDRNEGAQRLTALGGHIEITEYRLSEG